MAIMDWYSRYVISWKLSSSLKSDFCIDCLKQALKLAIPNIHNSDQGVQFTDKEYIAILQSEPTIKISMDGRGRCFDNIFTERLWRNVKYEEVYLNDYEPFDEAKESLNDYFHKYNYERIHESLNYQTPAEVYFRQKNQKNNNGQKNESLEWLLSPEAEARRYLMPNNPKDFIINNQIIQLNPKVEKITLNC
ncbi:MAG: integrase core domain-containing protein [bacterium]